MRILILAFAIGVIAGLRSMTAPAVVAWAARLGRLPLAGTPVGFLGSSVAAWLLALAALAELVADKLPFTPNRTAVGPFVGRIVTGGLSGAGLAAAGGQPLLAGAAMGALGGVAGTFGGYKARTGLVRALGVQDWVVAVAEDAVAVGGAIAIVILAARS